MKKKKIGYGEIKLIREIIKNTWGDDSLETKKFNLRDILYILQEMNEDEGKTHLEHSPSIMRGFGVFRAFAKYLLHRNIANYDSMVLLTSEKGSGKSSAAIMLGREWCRLLGIRFDPNRHIAYNNQDVMEKIDNAKPFEVIIADEAVRFASSEDWSKKENKELKKKLAQIRTKHLLFILCFPLKINKVEKNYLESFTNYWCDIFGRGKGVIYVKDKNPANDTWRIKDFKNVGSYNEFTSLSQVEKKLKKHPNFWKIIKFPKPPDWLYTKYLVVREKNVYNDETVRGLVTNEDVHRALLLLALQDIMMSDTTFTMNRISLYVKNTYDIPITKHHIQNILMDAKQLVTKIREENIQ